MPFVIPFFIPHRGCPHQCLFCNQNSITGTVKTVGELRQEIEATLQLWLRRRCRVKKDDETYFAFYGGSFTCMSLPEQRSMLETVQPALRMGEIDGIRLSTRPDCVNTEICDFLRGYGVRQVELGVQSLDNDVLRASLRGHSVQDCDEAVSHLRQASIEIGVQLMPGLPMESRYSFMQTVKKTIALRPSFVRLYPAVVVAHSGLAALYQSGEYKPLTLDMAVALTLWARRNFYKADIRVVRMGLQYSKSLQENLLAGPYHPAFGEMIMSRDWLKRTRRLLAAHPGKKVRLTISSRDISAFTGIKGRNMKRLRELGLADRIEISQDNSLERGKITHVVCQSA